MTFLTLAVEGACDERALKRIAVDCGFSVSTTHNCRGKNKLDSRLAGYLRAAEHSPWFILRDLDSDAYCAPAFIATSEIVVPDLARFRIAVRSLEAWLFADRTAIAQYLSVSSALVPASPDMVQNPKRMMAELAARSRRRLVRDRMAPRPLDGALVGPEYEAALIEFIDRHWDYQAAAQRSPSLAKAISAMQSLYEQLR